MQLSSVSTLWSKGLCASTYEGAWISKTWDSKVGCISVCFNFFYLNCKINFTESLLIINLFQIEDFTDRSQNVARAVGVAQVQKINKCIQQSICYLFDFMNGSIQEPKLRGFLFGPDAAIPPLADKGKANCDEKPQLPRTLPPKEQPRDSQRGNKHAMSSNHTSKQASIIHKGEKRRGRTTNEGFGNTQQIMLPDPTLTKKMRAPGGWVGEMPSESWQARSTESQWGTATGQWGNPQRPATLDPMRTGYMLPQVNWQHRLDSVGIQPTISAGPIWRGAQQASLISNIGNLASHPSLKHHYTLPNNPVWEKPTFVSQHRAVGYDRVHSIDEVVPAPYVRHNPRHGPPYNPYGTR